MKGFDAEFKNLEDYILKITYRIWEQREVHKIRDWYGKKAEVFTPVGVTKGAEDVVKNTLEFLTMFPDRLLLGEDVIGEEMKAGLYYSSHRILSTMTHTGDGIFGKPTGLPIKMRIAADCICEKNQVIKEWMVRDQGAIVRCLGLDLKEFGSAQALALKKVGATYNVKTFIDRWRSGSVPSKKKTPLVAKLEEGFNAIWYEGNMSIIEELYHRGATSYVAGNEILNGRVEINGFFNAWKSSFPAAKFELEHFIENNQDGRPTQVALRWLVHAVHNGWGYFGKPTGAPIAIMGISHFEIRDDQIYRDFHLMDEASLWGQIAVNEQ